VEFLYRDLDLKIPPRVDCTVMFAGPHLEQILTGLQGSGAPVFGRAAWEASIASVGAPARIACSAIFGAGCTSDAVSRQFVSENTLKGGIGGC
jgi:hypothetical protein